MLRIAVLLLLLVGLVGPSKADPQSSQRWYESLSDSLKYEVQSDLILLGFYGGLADSVFGRGTYQGLTSFQTNVGEAPSGVLSSRALDLLSRQGDSVELEWGIDLVDDAPTQATLLLPKRLLPVSKASEFGTTFHSPDYQIVLDTISVPQSEQSFSSLFASASVDTDVRAISYKSFNEGRWAVAGYDNASIFYAFMLSDGSRSVGYTLRYSEERKREGGIVATFLASHFLPTHWLGDRNQEEPRVAAAPEPVQSPAPISPAPAAPPAGNASAPPTDVDGEWIGSFFLPDSLPNVLLLSGEISMPTALEFIRALRARPQTQIVALNSDGGLVDPALIIAHEIRERGLSTLVIRDSGCFSACAFVFFAGKQRLVEGQLGVHQLWNDSNDLVSGQAKLSDVVEALDDFGVHRDVLSVMLRTPPDEMHVFSPAEIARLGLNVGDVYTALEAIPSEATPARVYGWSGSESSDPAHDAPAVGGTQTISISTNSATPLGTLLVRQSIPAKDAFAISFAFQSSYGLAMVPAGANVTVQMSPGPDGSFFPVRVDVYGITGTSSVKAATILRTATGGFVAAK